MLTSYTADSSGCTSMSSAGAEAERISLLRVKFSGNKTCEPVNGIQMCIRDTWETVQVL